MSTITKEWLQKAIRQHESMSDEIPFGLDEDDSNTLAALRIALASLETESVAYAMADDLKDSSIISTPAYRDLGEAMERTVGDVVALYTAPPAPVSVNITRDQIRDIFMSNGFTIKDGQTDLKDYVFAAADELISLSRSQPPVSVPDEVSWEDVPEEITEDDMALASAWAHGFNQCRAAMLQGAEPVSHGDELPMDYQQGHKDGLEWAARLAEANHPQTGDWLYDDPLELAKAIRKGPDMPVEPMRKLTFREALAAIRNLGPIDAGKIQAERDALNEPVQGWIPCSERMPERSDDVLCATEFDGPGDWRKKVGYWHKGKWVIYGASWTPTYWMPLPSAPDNENSII